jgi:hypothetical protein
MFETAKWCRAIACGAAAAIALGAAGAARAAGEYDNPNEGLQPFWAPDLATADTDGDGIPQDLEFKLARQFMPTIWFHRWESCAQPAGNKNHYPLNQPGRLIYRVSKHPTNPAAIAIQYVILYQRDCGNALLLGLNGHAGDAEPFAITLVPNAECQHGYGIYSVRTWAHEGTVAEAVNTDIHTGQCRWGFSRYSVNHDRPDGRIIVSLSKHGGFLDATECNLRFLIDQSCKKDWTPADRNLWVGVNAGERTFPAITALAGFGFPGEALWLNERFCGGGARSSGCPGPIEEKFTLYSPAPAMPPSGGGGGGGDGHPDCTRSRIGCNPTRRVQTERAAMPRRLEAVPPVEWNACAKERWAELDLPPDQVGAPDCANAQ